ncbi:hypothetical protein BB457_06155 [Helicobacter pylori]|nr:hypothetical protein B0X30_08250 [Helicobacter pylori]OOQ03280.1 hypothetical protein B0X46_05665 [Helicobacter pylori]OOQ06231.1 hypothetical protein B0X40_05815 [Helicobacter pylori]PDW39269.1 hypothetical protein BB426_03060 [Helicobacter pylori]PDW86274.1 hypothetical protein BB388_04135 [Helicobacter pylori]
MSKFLPHNDSKFWHSTMLILIYSQTPLRALKNEVFKFSHKAIAYHHLTNIIKVVLNPKILKYPFE